MFKNPKIRNAVVIGALGYVIFLLVYFMGGYFVYPALIETISRCYKIPFTFSIIHLLFPFFVPFFYLFVDRQKSYS
jgi:hypothetical protein